MNQCHFSHFALVHWCTFFSVHSLTTTYDLLLHVKTCARTPRTPFEHNHYHHRLIDCLYQSEEKRRADSVAFFSLTGSTHFTTTATPTDHFQAIVVGVGCRCGTHSLGSVVCLGFSHFFAVIFLCVGVCVCVCMISSLDG